MDPHRPGRESGIPVPGRASESVAEGDVVAAGATPVSSREFRREYLENITTDPAWPAAPAHGRMRPQWLESPW